jgi:hypothetical protein
MEIMAQLDIPDKLAAGPRTAAQVAEEAGSNPEFTLRLLRAAVAGGLLSGAIRGIPAADWAWF